MFFDFLWSTWWRLYAAASQSAYSFQVFNFANWELFYLASFLDIDFYYGCCFSRAPTLKTRLGIVVILLISFYLSDQLWWIALSSQFQCWHSYFHGHNAFCHSAFHRYKLSICSPSTFSFIAYGLSMPTTEILNSTRVLYIYSARNVWKVWFVFKKRGNPCNRLCW